MYVRDKMYLKTQVLNVNSGPGHDKLFCGFSLRRSVGRKNACTLLNESFLNMLCRPWCHFPCNKDLLVNSPKYSIYLSVVVGNEQGATGDLLDQGIKPSSPASVWAGESFTTESQGKPHYTLSTYLSYNKLIPFDHFYPVTSPPGSTSGSHKSDLLFYYVFALEV